MVPCFLPNSHEIGHNLDMHHSGELRANGDVEEYGDTTCMMGYGDGQDDTRKCFNAAKMAELGWYDKIVSLNPVNDGNFDGKVIGVADYGDAANDHTLVVEIINPISTAENIFLTLNSKKGMSMLALINMCQIHVLTALHHLKSLIGSI